MKYLSIIILMVIALNLKAQTIDTSFNYCTAAKINDKVLQVNYPNYDTCTYVGIIKTTDDYKGTCVTSYFFGNSKRNVKGGDYTLPATQYAAWDGTVESMLRILASYLSVTFK
jgi:hypothetical protein